MSADKFVLLLALLVGMALQPSARAAISISICGFNDFSTTDCPPKVGDDPDGGTTKKPGESLNSSNVCDSSGKCMHIPHSTGQSLPTPAGWTGPNGPPSTATGQVLFTVNGQTYTSGAAACVAQMINNQAPFKCSVDSPLQSNCRYENGSSAPSGGCATYGGSGGTVFGAMTCPAGYSAGAGTTCNLSSASAVMKPADGKCDIVRTGNSFAGDAQDPDCGSGATTAKSVLQGSVSAQTVGASTNGTAVGFAIDAGTGATSINVSRANSNGTTTQTTVNGTAPGAGGLVTVSGTAVNTYQGTGTLQSGTPNAPKTKDPRDPCGLADTPKCLMDETGTPTDGALTAQVTAFNTAAAARQAALSDIGGSAKVNDLGLSLSIDWPAGSCSNPSQVIPRGHGTLTVDLCSHASEIGAIMDFVFSVFVMFYLFTLGTAAVGGRA